ncbi:hypothetical protein BIY21_08565 [Vibrio ponticus]|uniref:Lipoprotein n=1 Tax=Vibrio ponticus TaxID=265668 RepID=A0ABX3FK66_9VIBR|nr:hypothetical protein BIY21_08565 [Vibrio ponticus]
MRVLDRDSAMILGKAGVKWTLSGFGSCYSEYNLKFQAKDGKARLQYELLYGAAPYSECTGWPWPIVTGYEEVKTEFNDSAQKLEDYLRSEDSFSDF